MKEFRLAVYFIFGVVLAAYGVLSHAASYQSYQGSHYRNINGTMYWKGDNTSYAQSQSRVIESVNVGGKYIGVPYIGEYGAAVASAIVAAMKSTPGAIATSALLSWAVSKGLTYVDGGFKKQGEQVPAESDTSGAEGYEYQCNGSIFGVMGIGLAQQCASAAGWGTISSPEFIEGSNKSFSVKAFSTLSPSQKYTVAVLTRRSNCKTGYTLTGGVCKPVSPCPSGYTLNAGACFPDAYESPSESDWDKFLGVTPPDEVMKDICQRLFALDGKGCQVQRATVEAVQSPLSEYDANGNRQVASITPAPTADDPFRTKVDINNEKKTTTTTTDPNTGQTTTTTTTEQTKEDNPDFCVLHPESIVCAKMDTPDAADITKNDKTVSITPDGGWGPDSGSCPAPKTTALSRGGQMTVDYAMVCEEAISFRPVVIGFAWIAAVLIAIGITKRYG